MSIDFEAIKRKLERLSGTTRNRSVMWKPTEGEEHTVRLYIHKWYKLVIK